MRDRIFVSYRRSDTTPTTTGVRLTLEQAFGDDAVFVDVTDIGPGANFKERIETVLDRSAVVVTVIGPDWASTANPDGTLRLHEPEDWVRRELAYALAESDITVIPVLVDDAPQPSNETLPEALHDLAQRNSTRIRHESWASDWDRVLDRIAERLGRPRSAESIDDPAAGPAAIHQDVGKGVAVAGDNSAPITVSFGD